MKFSLATTAIYALSVLGAADAARIEIRTTVPSIGVMSGTTTLIGNDGKRNHFGNFWNGCRTTGFSWLREFCVDDRNARAHVKYTSGVNRCFRRTRSHSYTCGGPEGCKGGVCPRCYEQDFTEARCDWPI